MDIIEQLKYHDTDNLSEWIALDEKQTRKFNKGIVKFANENPEQFKQYCTNVLPKEFSSLSIVYEALSEFSTDWNQFLFEEIQRVISLAKHHEIRPNYIEVLEDIETEDIYSKDESIYIEIINFLTASLSIDNDEQFNLQLLSLLDWFLIEYDEDDDISEVTVWISRIRAIAENAKQMEVRDEAKEALENLDEHITYNDDESTLEAPSFFAKLVRFFN